MYPKLDNYGILQQLRNHAWLDGNSLAALIEFSLFNPATEVFYAVTCIFEFPMTGGVLRSVNMVSFQPYLITGMPLLLCESLLSIIVVMLLLGEARDIYLKKAVYFTKFWNLCKFLTVILAIASASLYFWNYMSLTKLMDQIVELPSTFPAKLFQAGHFHTVFIDIKSVVAFLAISTLLKFSQYIKGENGLMRSPRVPFSQTVSLITIIG